MADNQDVVNLLNPSGSLVGLPSASAKEALANGYKLASPADVAQHFEKQDFTSGANPYLAAGAGFLRGGTLGLSDVGLTKSGLVKPETLQKLEEYNPGESMGGEGLAIGASLLIPGEGEAAAASGVARQAARVAGKTVLAPLEGVSSLGRAAVKGVQAALPAETALGRVAAGTVAHGVGGAVEGGLFGLGRAISEDSMGDPEALGEKLMSHVGFSAMIGSGIGGAIGGTAGLSKEAISALKKAMPNTPLPNEILKDAGLIPHPDNPQSALGDAIGIENRSAEEQRSFFKGKIKRAENANDVEAIGQKHNIPVLEEQLTHDEPFLKTAEALRDGGSPVGQERVRELQKGWDYWRDRFNGMFGATNEASQKELGDSIATRVADRISEGQSEFGGRYGRIKEFQDGIHLSDDARLNFFKDVEKEAQKFGKYGDAAHDKMLDAANTLLSRNTGAELMTGLQNVKEVSSQAWRSGASHTGTGINRVVELADEMLHKEGSRLAKELEAAGVNDAQSIWRGFVDEYEKTISDYKAFKKETANVAQNLKLSGKQAYQIKEALLKKNPQDLVKLIFNNKNVRTAEFFNKYAPDIMNDVKAYQRAELRSGAIAGEGKSLNPKQLSNSAVEMEKELKNILFSADEQMLLKEGATYLNSYPTKFNGSGTASMASYMGRMFNIFKPGEAAGAWASLAKDHVTQARLRSAGLKAEDLAHANWLGKTIEKTNQKIQSGAKGVFKTAKESEGKVVGFAAEKAAEKMIDHDGSKKLISQIQELQGNPQKFIDQLEKATKPIFKIAPGMSAAAHQSTVRAVQYLAQSAPQLKSPYPLGEDFSISKSEMHIFAERVYTINNPTVIMDELRNGTVVPAHIEAVATVYPKMFQDMKQAVLTELNTAVAKKQQITYRTKNMLSMFLGQDLDASITPQQVMANQVSLGKSQLTSSQQDQMMMGKTTQSGLGKMDMANNLRTDMQKSSQRIEKS